MSRKKSLTNAVNPHYAVVPCICNVLSPLVQSLLLLMYNFDHILTTYQISNAGCKYALQCYLKAILTKVVCLKTLVMIKLLEKNTAHEKIVVHSSKVNYNKPLS